MKTDSQREVANVGKHGRLRLDYARQGQNTIVARSRCTSPWHFVPPIYLDDTGSAYTLLLNPSGGLVGGDRLSIEMSLDTETHVLISTPSANRVYRSLTEPSIQNIHVSIGKGAVLEWAPEPTIPFAGSRFCQRLHVTLDPGATVLLWDAVAAGRIAMGERWAFASLQNEIRIISASGASVLERYHLSGKNGPDGVGLAGAWDYMGSLFIVNESVEDEVWKKLEEDIVQSLKDRQGRVLGGVSEPAVRGRVVKLLAKSAPDLNATFESIWAAARALLWGLPFPALRRY